MRRVAGIVAFQLKRARVAEIPSKQGLCEACQIEGEVHYMVAAKLPRYMYLCREHYLRIRDRLEKALERILREEKLL